MASRGLSVHSKVLSFSIVDSEQDAAARLAVNGDARLLKLERLRLGGEEPFALETCYLNADDFPGLERDSLETGSLFSILKYNYGVDLSYADEEIDATNSSPDTARLLKLPHGLPLLRIRQVIYSTRARPTVYVLGFYRSDRHRVLIRRYR
jgi:GntR family transcriptional regulator